MSDSNAMSAPLFGCSIQEYKQLDPEPPRGNLYCVLSHWGKRWLVDGCYWDAETADERARWLIATGHLYIRIATIPGNDRPATDS